MTDSPIETAATLDEIEWLESVLQREPAIEVFLAGLRHSADGPTVAYQVELSTADGRSSSVSAPTLREAINAARSVSPLPPIAIGHCGCAKHSSPLPEKQT